MKPRNPNQPAATTTQPKRMTTTPGNTVGIILNQTKCRFINGEKLFNSNPVLRKFTKQDMIAAKIKIQINGVPDVARDIEIAENLLNKLRNASGVQHTATIEKLYRDLESLRAEANAYEGQKEATKKQLNELIKSHPTIMEGMISEYVKEK